MSPAAGSPRRADGPHGHDPGQARQRTRLAWVRTAVAFAALAAALVRNNLIAGLLVLAAAPVIWVLGRLATRTSRPQVLSRRLLWVTVTVTAVCLLALAAAFAGRAPVSLSQLFPRHG